MGLVSLVDEARYVPNKEPSATLEEGSCREAALASALEGLRMSLGKRTKSKAGDRFFFIIDYTDC
jgi:hypothetical protein